MDTYVSVATFKAIVAPNGPDALDDRLAAAVVLGSRYVDRRLGHLRSDEPVAVDPDALVVVAADPTWVAAATAAASYYYKLPDAPMGYLGGLAEYAVRVKSDIIPTADACLFGQVPLLIR